MKSRRKATQRKKTRRSLAGRKPLVSSKEKSPSAQRKKVKREASMEAKGEKPLRETVATQEKTRAKRKTARRKTATYAGRGLHCEF